MKKLLLCAGARPNFMKIAALVRALKSDEFKDVFEWEWVHTGQHRNPSMSFNFLKEFDLPRPKLLALKATYWNESRQLAHIISGVADILEVETYDIVVVVGDTTSTLACALAANKLKIPVAHVEAGMRCFDMTMPEEVNRVLTDRISTWLFCTDTYASTNLLDENIERYEYSLLLQVGDIMIDCLRYHIENISIPQILNGLDIYFTLHRQANVDSKNSLESILYPMSELAKKYHLMFPIHPRTRKKIDEFGLNHYLKQMETKSPLSYYQSIQALMSCKVAITDSGGIQPEACYLKKPCLILRNNTERPFTLHSNNQDFGTSYLLGNVSTNIIVPKAEDLLNLPQSWYEQKRKLPWQLDGNTAVRILKHLA